MDWSSAYSMDNWKYLVLTAKCINELGIKLEQNCYYWKC